MSINEYVIESKNLNSPSDLGGPERIDGSAASSFHSSQTPSLTNDEIEKNELVEKREILIDISVIDGLKKYVGENYTVKQIRKMRKEKLEAIFKLYKKKSERIII